MDLRAAPTSGRAASPCAPPRARRAAWSVPPRRSHAVELLEHLAAGARPRRLVADQPHLVAARARVRCRAPARAMRSVRSPLAVERGGRLVVVEDEGLAGAGFVGNDVQPLSIGPWNRNYAASRTRRSVLRREQRRCRRRGPRESTGWRDPPPSPDPASSRRRSAPRGRAASGRARSGTPRPRCARAAAAPAARAAASGISGEADRRGRRSALREPGHERERREGQHGGDGARASRRAPGPRPRAARGGFGSSAPRPARSAPDAAQGA